MNREEERNKSELKKACMRLRTHGDNADRHNCKDCRYRAKSSQGCDYFSITNRCRPCDVEFCFLWQATGEIKADPVEKNPQFYENLRQAIVKKASDDYVKVFYNYFFYPNKSQEAVDRWEYEKASCIRFFKSDYFYGLTGLDGVKILRQLDEMIEELRATDWLDEKEARRIREEKKRKKHGTNETE